MQQGYDQNEQGFQGGSQVPQNVAAQMKAHNVLQYSFSGSHLLEVALMFQRQQHAWKKHYFAFIKLLPGGKAGAGRTYIPDQHITMKLGMDKVMELSKAIRAFSNGFGPRFGPFSTFTDTSKASQTNENTNAGQKSLTLFHPKVQGGQLDLQKIMLMMSLGERRFSFPMTPYYAGSMADIIEKIASRGVDLELDRLQAIGRRNAQAH